MHMYKSCTYKKYMCIHGSYAYLEDVYIRKICSYIEATDIQKLHMYGNCTYAKDMCISRRYTYKEDMHVHICTTSVYTHIFCISI